MNGSAGFGMVSRPEEKIPVLLAWSYSENSTFLLLRHVYSLLQSAVRFEIKYDSFIKPSTMLSASYKVHHRRAKHMRLVIHKDNETWKS